MHCGSSILFVLTFVLLLRYSWQRSEDHKGVLSEEASSQLPPRMLLEALGGIVNTTTTQETRPRTFVFSTIPTPKTISRSDAKRKGLSDKVSDIAKRVNQNVPHDGSLVKNETNTEALIEYGGLGKSSSNISKESYAKPDGPLHNPETDSDHLIAVTDEDRADYVYFDTRSDIRREHPERGEKVEGLPLLPQITKAPHHNYTTNLSSSPVVKTYTYSTMSWLDAFMYEHRGFLWILFNNVFMASWVLVGILALYRLLGLPWCSLFLSRTQYLVIHLLIFTAATFEFVQLIHLSYGSHEGLPLFLTLLLTHTPSPCLAVGLIIMTYCIFVSTRVSIFGNYLPPLIYISILGSFVIVLSFVGDIIVGVSRNSVFLIIVRVSLIGLCLVWLVAYIFNYRKIVRVALLMRREFRGELKSLSLPTNYSDQNQDPKRHLKKVLLTWSRITLVSCIFGLSMCIFSFCLSLFFTVAFVPLWAFWVLHSAIFVSQIMVVICLTFGAAFTLTYASKKNIFYKYFFPSFITRSSSNASFIKRGNFIYQRVSATNGRALPPVVSPSIIESDERSPLRNKNINTQLSTPLFRANINLKRSATFNCVPPYGFHNDIPTCSNLYPVLSDHILPYSHSQLTHDFHKPDINSVPYSDAFHKTSLRVSNSFNHFVPKERTYTRYSCSRRYPMRSFQGNNCTSSGTYRRSIGFQSPSTVSPNDPGQTTTPELAGTVEALDISYAPMNMMRSTGHDANSNSGGILSQIPDYHSSSIADRHRARLEPPEKPSRKNAEPILVKSIIKDLYIESATLPVLEVAEANSKKIYSSNKRSYQIQPPCVPSNFHSSPEVNPGFDIIPVTELKPPPVNEESSGFSFSKLQLKNVGPTSSSTLEENNCSLKHIKLPNLRDSSIVSKQQRDLNIQNTTVFEHLDEKTGISDGCEDPLIDNLSLASTKLEVNSSFDVITTQTPKNCSLKRNHSTAGDFPTRPENTLGDRDGDGNSALHVFSPPESNRLKYPWYGTWGGRRKSKKRDSFSDYASVNLRRLSASKSSLSNLYEKLKQKRSKSMYQPTQPSNEQDLSPSVKEEYEMDGRPNEDIISACEEEEEEILPRLEEDIDLASDIFKSSSVLADFYSLKRSDLKKRKNSRRVEGENRVGDGEGRDGVNGEEESINIRNIDVDKEFDLNNSLVDTYLNNKSIETFENERT